MAKGSRSGPGTVPPTEVFLSHAVRDRAFVRKILHVLRSHHLPVWYSETNIRGAQQWHDEIGRALARCTWFVVVLSEHSVRSKWVKRELLYALNNDRYNERVVPVLYRTCDDEALSWTLPSFQRVDFTGDFEEGCRELLKVWGLGYGPTKT